MLGKREIVTTVLLLTQRGWGHIILGKSEKVTTVVLLTQGLRAY